MACHNFLTTIKLKIDNKDRLLSFELKKVNCAHDIIKKSPYAKFCYKKSIDKIFKLSYPSLVKKFRLKNDEDKFYLHAQWDALRTAIAKYLGIETADIDKERCQIVSIDKNKVGVEIEGVLLPPKIAS